MEAYPNRDSLVYRELFGLAQARTLIRGTLRYPGWCATWHQIVRLGLTTERISIPRLAERSFAELVEMFLPESSAGLAVEEQAATTLGLDRGGAIMANLRWLGLFSDEPIGIDATTATDALVGLLRRKLLLPPNGRDMVVPHHILEARFPGGRNDVTDRRRVIATLVQLGEPGGMTAMARSVGLPAAIATRLVLEGRLDLAGCHIPTEPAIYQPVLAALASEGLQFHERTLSIDVDP
jgi:saccharopine dehydrogenase (NADP+, L-glutamate forming)